MALTIHELSVSNYRSIYEEVVLDLRIPGTAPDLPRFRPCQAKLSRISGFRLWPYPHGAERLGQDDPCFGHCWI